jgi:hypothetical protein
MPPLYDNPLVMQIAIAVLAIAVVAVILVAAVLALRAPASDRIKKVPHGTRGELTEIFEDERL